MPWQNRTKLNPPCKGKSQARSCRRVDSLPVHVIGATGRKVIVWGVDLRRGSRGGGQNLCLLWALENGGIELGFLKVFAVIRPCCRHRLPWNLRTKSTRITFDSLKLLRPCYVKNLSEMMAAKLQIHATQFSLDPGKKAQYSLLLGRANKAD